jgi:hypothetical protein
MLKTSFFKQAISPPFCKNKAPGFQLIQLEIENPLHSPPKKIKNLWQNP